MSVRADPVPGAEATTRVLTVGLDAPFLPGEAVFNDAPCRIEQVSAGTVTLHGVVPSVSGRLVQHNTACTAHELSFAFAQFWEPLWNRDGDELTVDDWPAFAATLHSAPLPELDLHLDPFQEDLWAQAARRLSSRKATGVCGWAPAELLASPVCHRHHFEAAA